MKKIAFALNCYGTYFELNKFVNNENLQNFFEAILKENNIDVSKNKGELLKKISEEELIYPGGITFYEDDKELTTGCCFELNNIKEACINIRNSQETWLGHDPDIVIKYTDNKVIIFESSGFDINKEPDNNEKIEYTNEEINYLIDNSNNNFKQFIDVFYNYLTNNNPEIADILRDDLKKYTLPENI